PGEPQSRRHRLARAETLTVVVRNSSHIVVLFLAAIAAAIAAALTAQSAPPDFFRFVILGDRTGDPTFLAVAPPSDRRPLAVVSNPSRRRCNRMTKQDAVASAFLIKRLARITAVELH